MRTYSPKASEIERQWHVIDASGRTLGRLATEIARLLQGKHKPIVSSYLDIGDFVVVINAAKVQVTGRKLKQKIYYRHSNYHGGLKRTSLAKLLDTHPTRVIEHAVKGMLPHNSLGRSMARRLKVYAGDTHPHQAQVRAQKAVEKSNE
jgi:large subunit ribosomal protein L13